MSVREVTKDPDNLTLTLVGAFTAPVGRVWRVWADPKLLGAWWGPPGWPATFVSYAFEPGGAAHYYMQGPDGARHHAGWVFTAIDAQASLAFDDYFADAAGAPNPDLPTAAIDVRLAEASGVTTMTVTTRFPSPDAMEKMLAMGMADGMSAAMGQIDGILAAL